MMNWNSNDTKYIIKRLILYVLIGCIVFFAGQKCASAVTVSSYIADPSLNNGTGRSITISTKFGTINFTNASGGSTQPFKGLGEGKVYFSLLIENSSQPTSQIKQIELYTNQTSNVCYMSTGTNYTDTTVSALYTTIECPVYIANNDYITGLGITRTWDTGQITVSYGSLATFVSKNDNTGQNIIDANNNIVNNQINNDNRLTQEVLDEIDNSTTIISNSIENQTQSINDMNDWLQQDHDPLIDTEFIDVFDDLWTTQDDDVIRQFIMIPFNLFVLIYNSLTANSCNAVQLGSLYNVTLSLPCINIKSFIGQSLYNTIDVIFAAGLLFGLIRFIKHVFNKIFTLSGTITDDCGVEVFN